jgi:ribosomal protein S18 acetylase RimI-like enzyme
LDAAWRVRLLRPDDRESIERILRAARVFSEQEVQVALELIDEGLATPHVPDAYRFVVAEAPDGAVAGYACYGSTPGMPGTFDLYWIAVEPALQGQGVGKILISAVEDVVAREGAARIVVETSSREDYEPTRAFYDKSGYALENREADFYSPGDDKVTYVKRLDDPPAG